MLIQITYMLSLLILDTLKELQVHAVPNNLLERDTGYRFAYKHIINHEKWNDIVIACQHVS